VCVCVCVCVCLRRAEQVGHSRDCREGRRREEGRSGGSEDRQERGNKDFLQFARTFQEVPCRSYGSSSRRCTDSNYAKAIHPCSFQTNQLRARRQTQAEEASRHKATRCQKMGHGVERDLCSFNIPPTVRTKLTRAGFRTSKDLEGVSVVELTKGDDDNPTQQRLQAPFGTVWYLGKVQGV
jgi:hypothetical protein